MTVVTELKHDAPCYTCGAGSATYEIKVNDNIVYTLCDECTQGYKQSVETLMKK